MQAFILIIASLGQISMESAQVRGTHVWMMFGTQIQVDCYFDSTEGVTGVSGSQSAAAYATAQTHPSDPSNEDCVPLSGIDTSAAFTTGFGQTASAVTKVEVPSPTDPDCDPDPNSKDCTKVVLCNGCSSAQATTQSAPTSGNPNRLYVSTKFQTAAAFYECDLQLRPPPALIEPMISGGAVANCDATYAVTASRTFYVRITTEAGLALLSCNEVIGCNPLLDHEAGLPTISWVDTTRVCGVGDPELVWFEHAADDYSHSGEFSVTDDMGANGGSRTAIATLSVAISADTTLASSIVRESFLRSEIGDGDEGGVIDRCDLVHLRCLIAGGSPSVCDASYVVRLDMNLDGNIDGDDELEHIALLDPVPGDATGDWKVIFADITHVLTNWGQTGVGQFGGDVNLDGVVNFGDINFVNANYNKGVPNADPGCPSCP